MDNQKETKGVLNLPKSLNSGPSKISERFGTGVSPVLLNADKSQLVQRTYLIPAQTINYLENMSREIGVRLQTKEVSYSRLVTLAIQGIIEDWNENGKSSIAYQQAEKWR